MIRFDDLPSVNASVERLADWLEFLALSSDGHSVSRSDLIRDLGISGTTDAIENTDVDGSIEATADDVFSELDERIISTGGDAGPYPFTLSENVLALKTGQEGSIYVFLCLLALWAKQNDRLFKDGAKLFEDVSAEAIRSYLGGTTNHAKSTVFGFPRRILPKGFADAVDALCKELGEGIGVNRKRPKLMDQKDAKLDVVAWREFLDKRPGKIIAFGQCAAGQDWAAKKSELGDPCDWWTTWIADRPGAWPIKAFFVPHRVSSRDWLDVSQNAGVLFDRCRISQLASPASSALVSQCSEWSRSALEKVGRP